MPHAHFSTHQVVILESLSAPWAWQENFQGPQEVEMPVWPRHSVEVEGPVISILRVIFVSFLYH